LRELISSKIVVSKLTVFLLMSDRAETINLADIAETRDHWLAPGFARVRRVPLKLRGADCILSCKRHLPGI